MNAPKWEVNWPGVVAWLGFLFCVAFWAAVWRLLP